LIINILLFRHTIKGLITEQKKYLSKWTELFRKKGGTQKR
jgi:hypothetical protein